MSRGKGRTAQITRTVIARVTKPGLSPGDRRRAEHAVRAASIGTADTHRHGGQKRSKRRAKIAANSKRRNR